MSISVLFIILFQVLKIHLLNKKQHGLVQLVGHLPPQKMEGKIEKGEGRDVGDGKHGLENGILGSS